MSLHFLYQEHNKIVCCCCCWLMTSLDCYDGREEDVKVKKLFNMVFCPKNPKVMIIILMMLKYRR